MPVFNAECYYFLAAGWFPALMTDKAFILVVDIALRRTGQLDLDSISDGPRGWEMLDIFENMSEAMEVFRWTIFGEDVILRDPQTDAACQVHI